MLAGIAGVVRAGGRRVEGFAGNSEEGMLEARGIDGVEGGGSRFRVRGRWVESMSGRGGREGNPFQTRVWVDG